ncbi:MAG: hypothetical protein AAF310_05370 [Myxococcota bacterium]
MRRRYNDQFYMLSSTAALRRQQLGRLSKVPPPDDIGNRAIETTARACVADDIGNTITQEPTHLESGVLQFLRSEWRKGATQRYRGIVARHVPIPSNAAPHHEARNCAMRQPPRPAPRRKIEAKGTGHDACAVAADKSSTPPAAATRAPHQRKHMTNGEQMELKRVQAEQMVQKTIQLCACHAHIESKILFDDQENRDKIFVFVKEEEGSQPGNEGVFAAKKPALAALETLAHAATNSNYNELMADVRVLPMEEKSRYVT